MACITKAAQCHGVSRVTVYKAIKRTGAEVEIRSLVATQRLLAELAAGKASTEAVGHMADIVKDKGAKANDRARAAETLRKFMEPASEKRTTVNFASAERGGVAVAGDNAEAAAMSVDLPTHPAERSMPLKLVHSMSRAIIEADNAGDLPALEVKGEGDRD